jgi:putative DNA primase/helicase
MLRPVRDIAQGRWKSILPAFNVDARALSGKNSPCPSCGGKDRFQFTDKEGHGTWFCRKHDRGGDGIELVMLMTGLAFAEAAKRVEELAGEAPVSKWKPECTEQQHHDAMAKVWQTAKRVQAGDPVDRWLRNRAGVSEVPSVLRTALDCLYQDHDGVRSRHPAMIARVTGPDDRSVMIHRTYLTPDGRKAPVAEVRKTMPGTIPPGSSVRLFPIAPVLGIAEGIETAFAAAKLHQMPVWSALNATILSKWQAPAGVSEVVIFADNDESFAGQRAAYVLAERLRRDGLMVDVELPKLRGFDWNDELIDRLARAAA